MIIDNKILKSDVSNIGDYCYCAIIAISKRAREIVESAERSPDNPVQEAYKEFEEGKFFIELSDE